MNFELIGTENSKTVKGEKRGYKTFIMYLAPNTMNSFGVNLCPMATKGCISSCLNTAGYGGILENVKKARLRRSNLYITNRLYFLNRLYIELGYGIEIAKLDGYIPVIRLNGTSDIQWENIKVIDDKNIFELFPDTIFYDYTKIANRFNKKLPSNYHLTFSYSGEKDYYRGRADIISDKLLKAGNNVAVVFRNKLPSKFLGYPVVNGDIDDLRFTNEKGIVIGLKAKGKGKKDYSGFVVDC